MRVDAVRYEGEALVRLVGSLDCQTVGEVRERLWALLIEGVTEIVVDAGGLTSMDRIGLDVLDAVSRLLVEHGGRFVICSASETIGDFVTRARVPAITIVP